MAQRRAMGWRWLGAAILIACALALLLWHPSAPRGADDPVPPAADAGVVSPPSAAPISPAPQRACASHAKKACQAGDLFWFDGCGRAQELAEQCAGHACEDGQCVPPPSAASDACAGVSAFGECAGDVARACVANRLFTVDCARENGRCVMTSEGALCLPRDDKLACASTDAPLCRGNRLRLCVDGRWQQIDCGLRRAVCRGGALGPHCEADANTPLPLPAAPELCDGHDNDQDGRVDEDGACDPVPLVAFIPAGAKLPHLQERMQRELAILNGLFQPTAFRWAKQVEVSASYRTFDPKQLEAAADLLARSESKAFLARQQADTSSSSPAADSGGLDFYIAVLFTEQLKMEPPKAAISTLPNARCGGVRISDQPSPPTGLIVLSEARQPETLTHEIGHYLGLCHTHETVERYATSSATQADCLRSGDGICDTPSDPGPSQCLLHDACELSCREPARPDAQNIMSYYIGCRRELSSDQISEAERNLNLRRAWFRCLDPRDCPCKPSDAQACPPEMSCHPMTADSFACELDGPAQPGAVCRGSNQCAGGSFCVGPASEKAGTAHCVRPCHDPQDPQSQAPDDCTCIDVGLAFRVCSEDMH